MFVSQDLRNLLQGSEVRGQLNPEIQRQQTRSHGGSVIAGRSGYSPSHLPLRRAFLHWDGTAAPPPQVKSL